MSTNERPPYEQPDAWGESADAYQDHFVPLSEQAAGAALRRLQLRAGDQLLDVAAGTGAVTLQAAKKGAEVVAVDFAPGMLALLASRLQSAGLTSVTVRQMDGQQLELADASFDAAVSNFGLIFFPDVGRGLKELYRVLRPGGRAVVTSLPQPSSAPLMQRIVMALLKADPGFRPNAGPPPLQLTDGESMEAALRGAGFSEVRCELEPIRWIIPDPTAFFHGWALAAPPVAAMMKNVSPQPREADPARNGPARRAPPPVRRRGDRRRPRYRARPPS